VHWRDKRVVVTGGGLLGLLPSSEIERTGLFEIIMPRSKEYDLRDRDAIMRLYETRPHIVFHLTAVVGGIGANRANPGKFYYDNAIMGLQMMEYARRTGVAKFIAVGTICATQSLHRFHSRKKPMARLSRRNKCSL
jgi:GDP-L-fucose synthase